MRPIAAPSAESGETGIGTMIVFIAAVLVAAVAAGVLISTTGNLQQKATRTGNEATDQVASNIHIESVHGLRDTSADAGLKDLEIFLELAPGAADVDVELMRVQIRNGTSILMMSYVDGPAGATEFNASAVRDVDQSFTGARPVMTSGDLVKLRLDLEAMGSEFRPRDQVRIDLIPEVGISVGTAFLTPHSYGTKTVLIIQ